MKKQSLFRKLWLPAVMASVGLTLLFGQLTGFDHNHAVIATYYIYDPVTGYATARVTLFQDGCKETTPLMEPSIPAVVTIFDQKGAYVGKWAFGEDKTQTWYGGAQDGLMVHSSPFVKDLLSARSKRRPSEKFFLV